MKTEIAEAYKKAVEVRVAGNGHSSWGADDSVAVIEAVTDAAYLDGEAEGFDAIRGLVKELVNPSAFRQKLEKLGKEHPAHVKAGEKVKRVGSAALSLLG